MQAILTNNSMQGLGLCTQPCRLAAKQGLRSVLSAASQQLAQLHLSYCWERNRTPSGGMTL